MEAVAGDADVTFLLTTNRADLLEEVLAARPGLIDHAARLPLPDAAARAALPPGANGSTPARGSAGDQGAALRVSARHLNLALDELLDSWHDLTRVLLGSRPMRGADAIIRPVLPTSAPPADPGIGPAAPAESG